METIAEWYAGRLRPKVRLATRRGEIARGQAETLERLMADLIASERSSRRRPAPGRKKARHGTA